MTSKSKELSLTTDDIVAAFGKAMWGHFNVTKILLKEVKMPDEVVNAVALRGLATFVGNYIETNPDKEDFNHFVECLEWAISKHKEKS